MTGWIKIYRSIKDHWIWRSGKLQWWIDILLTVNHADSKVLIGGELLICKRGQSIRSLGSWAREWNVSKKTVRTFFKLLQEDEMIRYESIKFSTRITVCKYDSYQDVVNEKDMLSKREGYGKETGSTPKQECKKDKNDKKTLYSDFYDSEIEKSENDGNYIEAVKILHGKNNLGIPLTSVLAMANQLSFDQFKKIWYLREKFKFSITEILEEMENWLDLKKRKTVYNTFLTFIKNRNPTITLK
jgi:hypothetical protein